MAAVPAALYFLIPLIMSKNENGFHSPDARTRLIELKDKEAALSLKSAVAESILRNADDVEVYLRDLLQHGCVSGMVPGLVYYYETAEFFDAHYHEIEDLRHMFQEELGQPLLIEGDLKNFLVWFAYEETARQIVEELELEI